VTADRLVAHAQSIGDLPVAQPQGDAFEARRSRAGLMTRVWSAHPAVGVDHPRPAGPARPSRLAIVETRPRVDAEHLSTARAQSFRLGLAVRTRTLAHRCVARTFVINSTPLPSGKPRSMTAISIGSHDLSTCVASASEPARPTTCRSDSRSAMKPSAYRNEAWSSTRNRRVTTPPQRERKDRAASRIQHNGLHGAARSPPAGMENT
jgi:hypothetical protein